MILGLAAVAMFSMTLPATRIAVMYLDPIFVSAGRGLVAAAVGSVILLVTRQPLPARRHWWPLIVTGLGTVIGFPILTALAMQHVSAAHGSVMIGILPITTAAFAALLLRERPSAFFWGTALLGAALIVFYALWRGGGHIVLADLLLLLSVLAASIGFVVGADVARELGGWQVMCWALLLVVPIALVVLQLFGPGRWIVHAPISGWFAFMYVALGSQLCAYFAWNKALVIGSVARTSQIQLLQSLFTVLISAGLLHEKVDTMTWIFLVLTIAVLLVNRRSRIHEVSVPD